MGFFKKLFGINNTTVEDNNEQLDENDIQLEEQNIDSESDSTDEEFEVIVNEDNEVETVELVDSDIQEDNQENVVDSQCEKKSIKEIFEEASEFMEKNEQATYKCNVPEIEHVSDLTENIGIINNEVVVEHVENPFIKGENIVLDVDTNVNDDNVEINVEVDVNINVLETEVQETEVQETEEETLVVSEQFINENTLTNELDYVSEDDLSELESEVDENEVEESEVDENEDGEELEKQAEQPEKKSFFAKLKEGVKKTRDSIFGNLNAVFNMFTVVDEELFEELEEALILADMGVDTSLYIINELRKQVKRKGITEVYQVKETLIEIISEILNKDETELVIKPQTVILVIGVNGAGKTTTIGKLTHNLMNDGLSVTVAAADTFRAAAIEQLQVWAERSGAHLIRKEEGSDPASVVFDACQSAKSRNTDVLIIDTAGRLQNKKNLMEELKKINRIIEREFENANKEVFLVLDSTTGQNAMQQAKLFNETADITGLILTKLDGTAKGGVIVSIKNELNVPVRYVGLGEKINDLERFDSKQFAKAMFE